MLLQPWGIYVNGKSSNQDAAWDFLKFLTNHENAFRLTSMTGWVSARQDVDWEPLLEKIPQFEVVRQAAQGRRSTTSSRSCRCGTRSRAGWPTGCRPPMSTRASTATRRRWRRLSTRWRPQTDGILKEADLYGTSVGGPGRRAGWSPSCAGSAVDGGARALGIVARRARIGGSSLFCLVALAPVLALFAYVRVYPDPARLRAQLLQVEPDQPAKPFVGWDNYLQLLSDDNFLLALRTRRSTRWRPCASARLLALAAGRVPRRPRAAVGLLPDRLLPAGDHADGADGDRLEVDLRLQLRHPQLRPVARRHRRRWPG